jgi:hypothetical protein
LNNATGTPEHEIKPDESLKGARWLDFALAPKANRLIVAGINGERQSFIEIWDLID